MALGIGVVSLWLYPPIEWNVVGMAESDTQERVDALLRLADAERARNSGRHDVEPQALSVRALERFPNLVAIGNVDREYGVRWAQSRSPVAPSIADIQALEQACDVAVRNSTGSSVTIVDRRDLPARHSGFVIVVPVLNNGRLSSFIVALGAN
jgi:hypothetical protein